MPDLSVAEYDGAERDAISYLPNRVVQAFQPIVFNGLGYPARVGKESELVKYMDTLHELRFDQYYTNLLGGLTEREFELLRELTCMLADFGESRFGQWSTAGSSVLIGLNVLRHIRYLFGEARPTVFEVGAGSGYLGALLMLEGYPYAATDVSQAFYLYQNHFWNHVTGGQVGEMAGNNTSAKRLQVPLPGKPIHIPWWEFASLNSEAVPQFDVITCNHALCEMHPNSLGFTLNTARAFLGGSETKKAFVFQGWGSSVMHSSASVNERFHRSDFVLVHNDPSITVFAPAATASAVNNLPYPVRLDIPVRFRRPRSLLRRLVGMPEFPVDSYVPRRYSAASNPLSEAILAGKTQDQEFRTVTRDQINHMYTEQLGDEDHLSPDDRFLMFVGKP